MSARRLCSSLSGMVVSAACVLFGCKDSDAADVTDAGGAESDAAQAAEASADDASSRSTPDAASDAARPRDAATARDAAGAQDGAPDARSDASSNRPEQRCIVFLHGKSGGGFATDRSKPDYLFVGPTGNADGWGGKQWLYFPDGQFNEVRQIIAKALDEAGCTRAILHGFSNGAAAVAKLYCRGVDFDARVFGFIIDDPVPDHAADVCTPPKAAKARLYWTGGLSNAIDGWNCQEGDWTCEGGSTVGIQKYAANLKLVSTESAKTSHEPYNDPPEYRSWW